MTTLRDLRIRANATQGEIAARCEVSQAAVSRWEQGNNPPLSKHFKRLCTALDCQPGELKEAIRGTMKGRRK